MANYWLLLSADGIGKYAGHTGYADEVASIYQWDETVAHANAISEGDIILLRDNHTLLGISVVDSISEWHDYKLTLRCPVCNTPKITLRTTKLPRYRCTRPTCRSEFDEPVTGTPMVRKFATEHGAGWFPLPGLMDRVELQRLCLRPQSIQSMRPLVPERVEHALGGFIDQMFRLHGGREKSMATRRSARVRNAPAEERHRLLERHGCTCLFVGESPRATLDGAALTRFDAAGASRSKDFVLLRRDVRSLVDLGQLAVEPERLRIRVSGEARDFSPYRELDGEPLQLTLSAGQRDWFGQHWRLHTARS